MPALLPPPPPPPPPKRPANGQIRNLPPPPLPPMRVNWDAQDALGRELAERKSPRNRDSSPMRPSARMSATGGPSWTAGGALRDVMVEKEIEAVADPAPAPAPVVVPPLGPRPNHPNPRPSDL